MGDSGKERWMRNLSLVESDVGSNLLLYSPSKELFYVLNIPAKFFWLLYTETKKQQRALDAVSEYYDQGFDLGTARIDCKSIIEEFKKHELLVPRPTGVGFPPIPNVTATKAKNSIYEEPEVRIITKEWMIKNHPATFHLGNGFGDTWDS